MVRGQAMRRRIFIAAIFLLAGAVVNVAVAWWCAMTSFSAHTEQAIAVYDSTIWQVDRISRTGAVVFVSVWSRGRTVGPSRLTAQQVRGSGFFEADPAELLADWTRIVSPTPEFESGEVSRETQAVSARGLPMLALWCETTRRGAGRIRGGFDTGSLPLNHWRWLKRIPGGSFLANPRVLPLRPLWPGFAVNTLFYAVVLWLLIPGPFVLRRLIRRRRGLCPACAYPMGESAVCSECGKRIPARNVTAT